MTGYCHGMMFHRSYVFGLSHATSNVGSLSSIREVVCKGTLSCNKGRTSNIDQLLYRSLSYQRHELHHLQWHQPNQKELGKNRTS